MGCEFTTLHQTADRQISTTVMSSQRASNLDTGLDGEGGLGISWDAEGRFRLQEAGLKLADSSRRAREIGDETGDALFRVQVELGLHELTAALSSLSRRLDTLEASAAAADEQDYATKSLERTARCVSQALPGIASARTRRRALHGYFRESDEQSTGSANRVDPATRALVVEGLACLAGKVNQGATSRGRIGDPDGPASDESHPSLRGTTRSAHGPGERKCGDAKSSTFAVEEGGYQEGEGVLETQRFPGERLDVKDLSTLSALSYSPSPVVGTRNGQDPRFSFALRKKGDGHENQHRCGEGKKYNAQAGRSRRRSRPAAQDTAARSIGNPTEIDTADAPDTWPSNQVANSAIGQKMTPISKCNSASDAASTNPPESTLGNCATGRAGTNTDHLADPPDRERMEDSLLGAAGPLVGAREQKGGSEGREGVAPAESERGTRTEAARDMEEERTLKALSPSPLTPPSSSCPSFSSLTPKDVDARRARRPPSRQQPSGSTIVSGEGDLDDPSLRGVEATTVEKRVVDKRAAGAKEPPMPEFGRSSEGLGEGPGVNREAALDAVKGAILEADSPRENDDGATGRAWKHELEAGLSNAWPCSAGGDELVLDDQGFLDFGALAEEETPELGEREQLEPREGPAAVVTKLEEKKANALRRLKYRLKEEEVYAAKPTRTIPEQPIAALDRTMQHTGGTNSNSERASKGTALPMARQYGPGASAAISVGPRSTAVAEGDGDDNDSAPRPDEHGGTAPLLSRLLAPPFDEELRRDFVLSLTRHLAEYGEGDTAGASGGGASSVGLGSRTFTERTGAFLTATVSENSTLHGSLVASAVDHDLQREGGENAKRDLDGTLIDVVRQDWTATAKEFGKEAAELVSGSDRHGNAGAIVAPSTAAPPLQSATTAVKYGERKEELGSGSGVREDDCGQFGRNGSMGGGERPRGSGENAPSQSRGTGRAGWAEEYHEYLCTENDGRGERGDVVGASGPQGEGGIARQSSKGDGDKLQASSDWAQEYHEYLCNKEKALEPAAAGQANA